MKFEEALELLRQGKKIRRANWENPKQYLEGAGDQVYASMNKERPVDKFFPSFWLADDWEEYKKSFVLKDHRLKITAYLEETNLPMCGNGYTEMSIKQLQKELIHDLTKNKSMQETHDIIKIIDKRFGI